jgi:negative regulator of genetic competence, sporulation and motility
MYFMDTCFYMQVFIVVRTRASNACASWTLAFMFKYVLSSVQMLLMHVLHGHLIIFEQVFIVIRTCASNAYAS